MSLPKDLPTERLLEEATRMLKEGKRIALVTIVRKEGSGPRSTGSKIIVGEDGEIYGTLGGGFFEQHVVKEALKAIAENKPKTVKYSFVGRPVEGAVDTGLICGGVVEVFIDVMKPSPRAIVFGVGRVGKPLADLLNFIGVRVVVADLSEELVSREAFPYAERRVWGSLDEVVTEIHKILSEGDVVFVTHGDPETDYRIVKETLNPKVLYVGLLGSKRKVTEFVKRLVGEGVDKSLIRDKLRGPVGADIPAETPEEISVSIVAELMAVLKSREVKTLSIIDDVLQKIIK